MGKRAAISKAETEVARIVWDLGKATVREVYEAIPEKRRPAFTTVQTYLSRLEKKGYLWVKIEGRAKHYRTRARPNQVVRETVEEFLNRLFDGQAVSLVRHLIDERGLTKAEYEELRQLIDNWEATDNG